MINIPPSLLQEAFSFPICPRGQSDTSQLLGQFASSLQDFHNNMCTPRALQYPKAQHLLRESLACLPDYDDIMGSSKLSGRQQSLRQPPCKTSSHYWMGKNMFNKGQPGVMKAGLRWRQTDQSSPHKDSPKRCRKTQAPGLVSRMLCWDTKLQGAFAISGPGHLHSAPQAMTLQEHNLFQ